MKLSARNQFPGTVLKVTEGQVMAEIVVSIEIRNDEIDNAADARRLEQWLVAAADELDRISLLPAQRAP